MLEEKAGEHAIEPGQMIKNDEKDKEPGDKTSSAPKMEQNMTNRTEWVGAETSQPGTKISKKEITFSGGSGKKAQPKQARSSSKPK